MIDIWTVMTSEEAATSGTGASFAIWDEALDAASETDILVGNFPDGQEAFMLLDGDIVELGRMPDHLRRASIAMSSTLSMHPEILEKLTRKMTSDPDNPWRVDVSETDDHAILVVISHDDRRIVSFCRSNGGMIRHAEITEGHERHAVRIMARMTARTLQVRDEIIAEREAAEAAEECLEAG